MSVDLGFTRPTLSSLNDQAQADINADVPGADARLRRGVLRVLSAVWAGLAHGLYGFIDYIARQTNVLTADTLWLDRWGAVWAVARKAATQAAGTVTFTGANGSAITAGLQLVRADEVVYAVTANGTIANGTATLAVEAVEAGTGGNADLATALALMTTVGGVNATATVAAGNLTGGADREADGEPFTRDTGTYRGRILARIAEPPHGGALHDYEAWALEVAGVTRAWCTPNAPALGDVTVRFMMDDTYANGIPQSGDVDTVQDHIDPLAPVTANVTVVAPIAQPTNVTIANLSPSNATVQAAVEDELADLFRRLAEPGGTIKLSKFWEAVSVATGEDSHVLTAPAADVVASGSGYIPTLGNVTFS